jgi:hypothetical protein
MMLARCWSPGDLAYALRYAIAGNPAADQAELDERTDDGPWMVELAGLVVHDRRNEVRGPKDKRGKPKPPRPWSQIFGATIHQTASGHLDADHPRILSVPAPVVIHRDASVSLLHPLVLRMEHGHALNGPTMGVEVDCRADGIEGDPDTFWRSGREENGYTDERGRWHRPKSREELRCEATDDQLVALGKVLNMMHAAHFHLAPPKNRPHLGTYVHLQGRYDRTTDPGSRIARFADAHRIARGWKDTREEHYGSGKPWPQAWRAA